MAEPRLTQVQLRVSVAGVLIVTDAATTARVAAWVRAVTQRKPEATWDVRLQVHRKRRTIPMNSMFHARCGRISQETGDDFEVVKHAIKMRAIKRGYRFETVLGVVEPEPSHLTDTVRCGYLLDECEMIEGELGLPPWLPEMFEEYSK